MFLPKNLRIEWFFNFVPRISRLPLFLVRPIVADVISGVVHSFALADSIASAAVSFGTSHFPIGLEWLSLHCTFSKCAESHSDFLLSTFGGDER
jgi:hypothetical protein